MVGGQLLPHQPLPLRRGDPADVWPPWHRGDRWVPWSGYQRHVGGPAGIFEGVVVWTCLIMTVSCIHTQKCPVGTWVETRNQNLTRVRLRKTRTTASVKAQYYCVHSSGATCAIWKQPSPSRFSHLVSSLQATWSNRCLLKWPMTSRLMSEFQ